MAITITALYTYPIKGCARLEHQTMTIAERGPRDDRRWMLVNASGDAPGRFISQREAPRLAIIQPSLSDTALTVAAPGRSPLAIPLALAEGTPTRSVSIWRDAAEAHDEGDEAAAWFSDAIGLPARLMRMADSHYREVDPRYNPLRAPVGFADGYPILLANTASLNDLNDRMVERDKDPVPMARFRPNVVISGAPAWAEDTWARFEIGGLAFDGLKLCARCAVPTVDQSTGERPDPTEPSATLALFRKRERGVMFGQNVVNRGTGVLHVGDALTVRETYATEAP